MDLYGEPSLNLSVSIVASRLIYLWFWRLPFFIGFLSKRDLFMENLPLLINLL